MKTKIFLALIYALLFGTGHPPQQINYTAPVNKLIPDPSFMQNADWKRMFYDASQTSGAGRAGLDKQIVIGPDEQVYVSDRSNFTISIYNSDGKFIKSFGKQGYGNGEFANNQDLDGILNDKLIVVSDNQGRINLFDLDGNFVKLLTIDFMPLRIFPLRSGKLMVWGHVPVKGYKYKHVLAELNVTSGNYNLLFEKMITREKSSYITITKDSSIINVGAPYSRGRELIRANKNDQVILAETRSGTVTVLGKSGGRFAENSFGIEGDPIPISEKEKEEFYRNFKARLLRNNMDTTAAGQVKAEGFFPEHMPLFYNMIVDEMNNLLFFIYTNTDGDDFAFMTYDLAGNFMGRSKFEIEGYDLLSNVSSFKLKDGYIYTLAVKIGAEYPLRILKCRVAG